MYFETGFVEEYVCTEVAAGHALNATREDSLCSAGLFLSLVVLFQEVSSQARS